MRELRIQHGGRPYRVLYAFDPRRVALRLIGGDKIRLLAGIALDFDCIHRGAKCDSEEAQIDWNHDQIRGGSAVPGGIPICHPNASVDAQSPAGEILERSEGDPVG
jgi:hypothetical protein